MGPSMLKLGKYKHYKGGEYEIVALAKDEETHEDLVVYRALYGENQVWVRPLSMFNENVEVDGEVVPRFIFLEER